MEKSKKVITEKKFGMFTLRVIAERPLTEQEMLQALCEYMQRQGLNQSPKSGMVTVLASHGYIDL